MNHTLKWLFAISLAINIMLIGFMMGRMAHAPHHAPRERPKMDIASLPADKQERLEDILKDSRERRKSNVRTIEATRKEIVDILTAPEFDEEAFIETSKTLNGLFASNKQTMIEEMAALAKSCTQEERRIIAEHLRKPPGRERGGKEGRKH